MGNIGKPVKFTLISPGCRQKAVWGPPHPAAADPVHRTALGAWKLEFLLNLLKIHLFLEHVFLAFLLCNYCPRQMLFKRLQKTIFVFCNVYLCLLVSWGCCSSCRGCVYGSCGCETVMLSGRVQHWNSCSYWWDFRLVPSSLVVCLLDEPCVFF